MNADPNFNLIHIFENFTNAESEQQLIIDPKNGLPNLISETKTSAVTDKILEQQPSTSSTKEFTAKVLDRLDNLTSSTVNAPLPGSERVEEVAQRLSKLLLTGDGAPSRSRLHEVVHDAREKIENQNLRENVLSGKAVDFALDGKGQIKKLEDTKETHWTALLLNEAAHFAEFSEFSSQIDEDLESAITNFLMNFPNQSPEFIKDLAKAYKGMHSSHQETPKLFSDTAASVFDVATTIIKQSPQIEREIHEMKPGQMRKLSRKEVNAASGQQVLSRSITIVKDKSGAAQLFAHYHKHAPGDKSKVDPSGDKKVIAKGGMSIIKRLEGKDNKVLVLRQFLRKPSEAIIAKLTKTEQAVVAAKVPHVSVSIAKGDNWVVERSKEVLKRESGNIYPLYSEGDVEGLLGFDLASNQAKNPLPPEKVLLILDNISEALFYLHQLGIYHLDLKLANLLLDKNGEAFLHDFDTTVHIFNPTTSGTKNELESIAGNGTPGLKAPEQEAVMGSIFKGGIAKESEPAKILDNLRKQLASSESIEDKQKLAFKLYPKFDSYSFSIMAYQMIMGKLPDFVHANIVGGDPAASIMNTVDSSPENQSQMEELREMAPALGYNNELIDLIIRGFSVDPQNRPSMGEYRALFTKVNK